MYFSISKRDTHKNNNNNTLFLVRFSDFFLLKYAWLKKKVISEFFFSRFRKFTERLNELQDKEKVKEEL